MKKYALVILFFLLSEQAYSYDGWSKGNINAIRLQASRILITQENATNPGNCSNTDYLYMAHGDAAYLQNMYSALLTAYATNAKIQLALTGCSSGGTSGYPVITEVWVLR
ncbi:hypothetical protein [Pseudoalteromonas luteoviolacea]|uniref:Uncharacterized protein n=1 Tax=Pseudoalteromonas luteoviolacea S4060-1 TaxID=1365257 RepID=A0A167P2D2_9GAMM|nr:hypothetical protein [Pseudoalteromonas luteoviolacea]KZN69332.1 hypothetical protein N478_11910 [Pseudoalteromonas luteoviolacea S4060-1]